MQIKKWLVVASAGVAGLAFGAAELQKYRTPGYVADGGPDRIVTWGQRANVTATETLAFEGATLAEIRDLTFGGYINNINQKGHAVSYFTHAYEPNGDLQFLVATVQKLDYRSNSDSYIKSVTCKLTQKADGVYIQRVNGPYFSTTDSSLVATRDFVTIANDGTIGFQNNTGLGGYNVQAFFALKVVPVAPSEPILFFANPAGGSTLTLEDIKDYRFTGIIIGGAVNHAYTRHEVQNKYVINGTDGQAERIRLELQVMDDQYLKCAFVELTNGAGGIYAQTIGAAYYTVSETGAKLGDPFLEADGSFSNETITARHGHPNGDGATITSGNYGAASLCAEYTSNRSYTLDASKTWSQLTGSSAAVADDSMDVTINVTAPDATLTFDVPVAAHSLILKSSAGHGATLAAATGIAAPDFLTWDFRQTTGDVTFTGFAPVADAVTANIVPNANSTLTFNADVNGFYPFNNTPVTVPCKAVVLGGEQSFPNGLSFSKLNYLNLTSGSLSFGGNVGGTGVITLAAGSPLGVTGPVTIANTVTVTNAANAAVELHASGDTASFTMNGKGTAGGFVLTAGTLHVNAAAANEDDAIVGAGGTLAITVTDLIKKSGYITRATVREGGIVKFFDANGVELGVGRPVMTTLPGEEPTWTASDATGDLDDAARWSTSSVPADNLDVSLSSGALSNATAVISGFRSYRQVTVQSYSDVVLKQDANTSATFTAGTLVVAPNAKVTIELPAVVCTNIQLGDGSELRILGAGTDYQAFNAVVSGTGKVSYLGGKVRITNASSYTGGTYVKAGALAQFGRNGTVFGNTGKPLVVEAGGAIDTNGSYDSQYSPTVAGDGVLLADGTYSGAMFNSKANSASTDGKAQYQSLVVSAPATLRADNIWGFVRGGHNGNCALNLGTNTLHKTGAGDLIFATKNSVQVSGTGTISVDEGRLVWMMKSGGGAADGFAATNAVLVVDTNATFEAQGNYCFKQVMNNGKLVFNTAPKGADITSATMYYGDGDIVVDGNNGKSCFFRLRSTSKSLVTVKKGRFAVWNSSGNNSAYQFVTPENTNANLRIVVEPGAQFDLNGTKDFNPTVIIAGSLNNLQDTTDGALVNRSTTAVTDGSGQIPQIILAGDALVGGYAATSDYGLLAPGYGETRLDLNTYTMTLHTNAKFWMANTTITGTGKLKVKTGTLRFCKSAMRGNDWTLETMENGVVNFDGVEVTCSNLVWAGSCQGNKGVTAYGTYKPVSTNLPAVVLSGPAAGIDASDMTEPWNIATGKGLAFAAGTKVNVDLGERQLSSNLKVLAWDRQPANVQVWTMTPATPKFRIKARADGLYVVPHNFIIYVR